MRVLLGLALFLAAGGGASADCKLSERRRQPRWLDEWNQPCRQPVDPQKLAQALAVIDAQLVPHGRSLPPTKEGASTPAARIRFTPPRPRAPEPARLIGEGPVFTGRIGPAELARAAAEVRAALQALDPDYQPPPSPRAKQ